MPPTTAALKRKQEALAKVSLKAADIVEGLKEMGEEDYEAWKMAVKATCGNAKMPTQIRCVCVTPGLCHHNWNVA